eukprot:4177489-Alexandrium_andersonii.AAC.1
MDPTMRLWPFPSLGTPGSPSAKQTITRGLSSTGDGPAHRSSSRLSSPSSEATFGAVQGSSHQL